jgi:hypothetical protein
VIALLLLPLLLLLALLLRVPRIDLVDDVVADIDDVQVEVEEERLIE